MPTPPSFRTSVLLRFPLWGFRGRAIFFALFVCLLCSPVAKAESLEILAPDTGEQTSIDLSSGELGELVIYLKSMGDLVGGYRVNILDDQDRLIGKNISDMFGVAKFTNIPPGRFRVFVVTKGIYNDRGGRTTVSVGDLRLTKIRK
jgi:hypothetical protein